MKQNVPFRIVVQNPLAGVSMMVQKGMYELLQPAIDAHGSLIFEFDVRADLGESGPNFLGPFAQGPKYARFLYVSSGKRAGEHGSCWDRRAKLSLMSITADMVNEVLRTAVARIGTSINGVGRDGGPVCASIKGLEWKVVK